MSDEFDEIIKEFLVEGEEMLDQIEPQLIEMSKNIDKPKLNDEVIDAVFRLFHSFKGTAGFLNFSNTQNVTHEAETLLDMVRKEEIQLSDRHINLLVRTTDFLRNLLMRIADQMNDKGAELDTGNIIEELKESKSWSGSKPEHSLPEEIEKSNETESPEVQEKPDGMQLEISREMVSNFIKEATEQFDLIEQTLLCFIKNPQDHEALEEVFRQVHTFKGNCGFLGFTDMERLSHKMEAVLEYVRKCPEAGNPEYLGWFLTILDALRKTIKNISINGNQHVQGVSNFLKGLDTLVPDKEKKKGPGNKKNKYQARPGNKPASLSSNSTEVSTHDKNPNDTKNKDSEKRDGERRMSDRRVSERRSLGRQDIRVDISKLDTLMELVGELIVAEKMVTHNPVLVGLKGNVLEGFEKASSSFAKNNA